MTNLLYLVGVPGCGKSTLAAALTAGHTPEPETKPFAHIYWAGRAVVELGRRRDSFSGTDTLSLSVQPKVIAWLRNDPPPLVLGEGDRLANLSFFREAAAAGVTVHVVYLACSADVAQHRRETRAHALGVPLQNPTWAKGRASKVRNLVAEWPATRLDADQPTPAVLRELLASGDPVATLLRSAP